MSFHKDLNSFSLVQVLICTVNLLLEENVLSQLKQVYGFHMHELLNGIMGYQYPPLPNVFEFYELKLKKKIS